MIQKAVVYWIRKTYPDLMFTISPIIKTTARQGKMIKDLGYNKGCPDLMIFEPSKGCHGLFIELKTSTGRLTLEQKYWLTELDKRGYYTIVCRSVLECTDIINRYLMRKEEKR